MISKPLIIVGLQKSGTSLLKKVLASSDQVTNLFSAEGNGFWGNTPPFSPDQAPVGTIYQKHSGKRGHFLSEEDYRKEDEDLIQKRLKKILDEHNNKPYWLHKNPYLTVRLSWLKRVFPDAVVLACVRKPLPNIFSLYKRYTHFAHGHKPENGWWGVKPKYWQSMVNEDDFITVCHQWHWVNRQLLADNENIDYLVAYHDLANSPQTVLNKISQLIGLQLKCDVPQLNCMDKEWQTGGSAVSSNQQIESSNQHELPMPKLSDLQASQGYSICIQTWDQLNEVLKSQG